MSKKTRAEAMVGKCFRRWGRINKITGVCVHAGSNRLGFMLNPGGHTILVPSRMRFEMVTEAEYEMDATWSQVKNLLGWLNGFIQLDLSNEKSNDQMDNLRRLWNESPGWRERILQVRLDGHPIAVYASFLFQEQLRLEGKL